MFPILFVTIACGAVSGFHSLVSSGTASKQIKSEKNMLPVSYGAMIMESMLAVIALIAVASFADGEAAAQGLTTQPQIFAGAIANFLEVIGLPHSLVFTPVSYTHLVVARIAARERSYLGVCLASPAAWVLAGGLLIAMYYYIMNVHMKKMFGDYNQKV